MQSIYHLNFWRPGVTRCILSTAIFMCCSCQCWLHVDLIWSHISILMRLLSAEPRSITGLLSPSQCLCETIWVTPVFDGVWLSGFKSRANVLFWGLAARAFLSSPSILSFYGLALWGWGLLTDRVCQSLSPCLALPIIFHRNNTNNFDYFVFPDIFRGSHFQLLKYRNVKS